MKLIKRYQCWKREFHNYVANYVYAIPYLECADCGKILPHPAFTEK